MIASLRGTLQAVGTDSLVLETGGIGFLVYAPRPLLSSVGAPGEQVFLHTMLIVREDSLTLYGFGTTEQRALFETLLGVSRVGPRVALAVLSSATPEEVRLAVAQNDSARLARVPGIGKQTAERLIVELKGKLDIKQMPTAAGGAASTAASAPPAALAANAELVDLLVSLGYSSAEASAAVATLPADAPDDLEERLRLALRYFGGA
jgi:Holliday junction DNA helicase RuvA